MLAQRSHRKPTGMRCGMEALSWADPGLSPSRGPIGDLRLVVISLIPSHLTARLPGRRGGAGRAPTCWSESGGGGMCKPGGETEAWETGKGEGLRRGG